VAHRLNRPLGAVIGLDEVMRRPKEVTQHLLRPGAVYGLANMEVRTKDRRMVVFWLTLEPWAPMAELGYPIERVSITVWPAGRVTAVTGDAGRRPWCHRYPFVLGRLDALGDLCLWYPGDPRPLRWEWPDGFVAYITIVHRHLQAEEYARRNQCTWPAEDAPHGSGRHPIRTPALQALAAWELL